MSSCLGLYIEEHLIKYAKVSKERDNIKVESFGMKFYDKIGDAISQIIEETYSQKTPISVNMSEEMYNYFDMFALLTKNDLQKAIKTEFESYCTDKGYNPNVFETRYAVADSQLDKDKIKIIHIADNKIELNKRIQEVDGYHLVNISPISMSIPNLVQVRKDEKIWSITPAIFMAMPKGLPPLPSSMDSLSQIYSSSSGMSEQTTTATIGTGIAKMPLLE